MNQNPKNIAAIAALSKPSSPAGFRSLAGQRISGSKPRLSLHRAVVRFESVWRPPGWAPGTPGCAPAAAP